ncbi:lysine 5,6-aminomutase reactivase subunit KamB [Clostridium felsineum]|uniref:Uncharacterized protein n=1 Tax=Clostridium felsineum TaxID=36839 RepID=A0A1S8L5Y1_9CLOT|nr:hypothetical protein [Clostridium felsineum]URZ08721.1 hypothetical protein CLROS_041150 [Clostridium felsineum]URZ09349.1 hypothetical protein CROST_000200 [Clostridium felsineum]
MYNDFNEFITNILKYTSISIIGMEKNTGKTTTLNFIINAIKERKMAITSIGRDGEATDIVTFTHKPRIYIRKDILVATAKTLLLKSDVCFEILEVLNIGTSMGDVVIAKSTTAGFVEIAGPATKNQIKKVISKLKFYGSDFILVDGALSRKSLGAPEVTEAVIISTGSAFSENANVLCEKTLSFINFLIFPTAPRNILELYKSLMINCRLSFVYTDFIKKSSIETSLNSHEEVISSYSDSLRYIFIKGILTDNFILKLLNTNMNFKRITFVVEDGTRIFIKKSTYDRFILKGGKIKVVENINVIGITINPWSPSGYELNYIELYNMFKIRTNLPVLNVKEYDVGVIE